MLQLADWVLEKVDVFPHFFYLILVKSQILLIHIFFILECLLQLADPAAIVVTQPPLLNFPLFNKR
jgi:hypothetical protein